jgi:hypothetical protein
VESSVNGGDDAGKGGVLLLPEVGELDRRRKVEEIGQKMGQRSAGNRGARAGKAGDRPKIGQLGRCRKMGAKYQESGSSVAAGKWGQSAGKAGDRPEIGKLGRCRKREVIG